MILHIKNSFLIRNYFSLLISRHYANNPIWPNDWLPFFWEKPEPVPGYFISGDIKQGLQPINMKQLLPEFSILPSIKNAPDDVKKLFSYEFAQNKVIKKREIDELECRYRISNNDHYSYERLICRYTIAIRYFQHTIRNFQPNNAVYKIRLNYLINKRRSFLNKLYKTNRENYNRLVKELEIDFTPSPPAVNSFMKVERKREIRKLTDEYCKKIIDEKLDAYHKKLLEQQKVFIKEKEEAEKKIEEYMKQFNISEECINEALKEAK